MLHQVGVRYMVVTNKYIYYERRCKKVLTMVLLENISLSDIEGYSEDVIDEVSFYLGEAFDLLMTAYE